MLLNELCDFVLFRNERHDGQSCGGRRFIDCIQIERIARRDKELSTLAFDRKQGVSINEFERKSLQ